MPATEAQVRANQANSLKSTGPKTLEGKAASRANALKHGLTGSGVVLHVEDAAEVERRTAAFQAELRPSGEVAETLVKRAALMAVRMERAADREIAATDARVQQAIEEFQAPEGVDAIEETRLRSLAGRLAGFDPSREASLARRYEAAAERSFFRALKELRQIQKAAKVEGATVAASESRQALASFSRAANEVAQGKPRSPSISLPTPERPSILDDLMNSPPRTSRFDVPIAIGRQR